MTSKVFTCLAVAGILSGCAQMRDLGDGMIIGGAGSGHPLGATISGVGAGISLAATVLSSGTVGAMPDFDSLRIIVLSDGVKAEAASGRKKDEYEVLGGRIQKDILDMKFTSFPKEEARLLVKQFEATPDGAWMKVAYKLKESDTEPMLLLYCKPSSQECHVTLPVEKESVALVNDQ